MATDTADACTVLLVSDIRLYREALAALLEADGRITVVTTDATHADLVQAAREVDVVVVAPRTEGAGLARRVASSADRPLVVVGVPDSTDAVVAYAEAGVIGFLEPDSGTDELVAGVRAAARGEPSCPPRITATVLERLAALAARPRAHPDTMSLTARERQIVALIDQGLSNKEIGHRLHIEVATVKNHVHNILEKLQVSRRGEAAARLRLVGPRVQLAEPDEEAAFPRRSRAS